MFGWLSEAPKPVAKSGVKRIDNSVKKALKASGDKCVNCHKRNRSGEALFCASCLKPGNMKRKRVSLK